MHNRNMNLLLLLFFFQTLLCIVCMHFPSLCLYIFCVPLYSQFSLLQFICVYFLFRLSPIFRYDIIVNKRWIFLHFMHKIGNCCIFCISHAFCICLILWHSVYVCVFVLLLNFDWEWFLFNDHIYVYALSATVKL